MSTAELLAHVGGLKRAANGRFAAGETEAACAEYDRALRLLDVVDEAAGVSEDAAAEARALRLALRLNGAACALRAQRYEHALVQADAALALSPNSTKATFRRGQALQSLGRLGEAAAAYGEVIEREPASREANAALSQVRASMGA